MKPEWQRRALGDPNLSESQARVIMEGPQSLAESWMLGALRLKYWSNELRTITRNVEK